MKKTLLASAILAGLVSVSAQAATVYDQDGITLKISGDVDATVYSDDSVDGSLGNANYASINLFGTTKVSDSVTAYAEFEIDTGGNSVSFTDTDTDVTSGTNISNTTTSKSSEFSLDELVVGLDTTYGDFSFGGVDSALGQVSDFTDIGNELGGIQEVLEGGGASGFAYANTFAGISLNAEFIASEDKDADSMGISAVYSLEGLSLGLGYVAVDEENQLLVAAGYAVANLYVGVSYGIGEVLSYGDSTYGQLSDLTTLEFSAAYQVTGDVSVVALLGQAEVEDADVKDYYALEVGYSLADNVLTTVGYSADNLDNADPDNSIYAQISYDF